MATFRKFTRKDGSFVEVNLSKEGTEVKDNGNPIEVKYVDDNGRTQVKYINKNDIEEDETYEKPDNGTGIIGPLIVVLILATSIIYSFCSLPTASR